MDEKPDQIMSHIESQRDQLGRNLNELESRVKRTTDWRAQFDRNPMLMMGVALGGGLLLGTMTASSSHKLGRRSWSPSSSSEYGTSSLSGSQGYSSMGPGSGMKSSFSSPVMREQKRKASDTLEHIKSALIGFATAKVKEFMTEALPGFNLHLEEAEQRASTQAGNYPGRYGSEQASTGQQSTGLQSPSGYTRTEHSAQTHYKQQPVGTGINS
jgi:hypothetical protein